MSENDALRFIERLGTDLALQAELRNVDPPGDLEQATRIAARAGFDFDADELRAAFRADWQIRRRFYGAATESSRSSGPKP